MAVTNRKSIDFFDFVDGLNTVDSGIKVKQTEFRDCQDVDFFPIGGWSKRNGYTPLNTTPLSSAACTGLYMARYSLNGGTNIAYLTQGTKLYRMSASLGGTWTDSTNGLTITTGANNIWNFAMLKDIAVLGNGTDTPIQISSAGTATALSGGGVPFTSFLFPVEARGYMFYFRPTVSATIEYDRCYFSTLNDPVTVDTNDYVDVAKGQGGDVKGAVEYKTFLYIFKRHGIYQMGYQPTRINSAGDIFPWSEFPNPVVKGVGTQSHRSIVKFTTPSTHLTPGQELIFFIDQYGIPRIFDGTTTISFASKIGSSRDTNILSLSNMDNTRLPYSWAVNYPTKNRIEFFLSSANSQQNRCWVMDYNRTFSFGRKQYASAFNVGALFEKANGTWKPYYGDYAGTVYENDTGTSDNGFPISDYIVTGDNFNASPFFNNRWSDMNMIGATGDTDENAKISFYFNGSDTPQIIDTKALSDGQTEWGDGPPPMIWGVSSWSRLGLVRRTQEVGADAKTCRVRVESEDKLNDTLIMEGFGLEVSRLGNTQD